MGLPRITIRRLMALAAVVGVVLAAWVEAPRLRARAGVFRSRARSLAASEKRCLRSLGEEVQTRTYWKAMAAEWSRRATSLAGRDRSSPPRDPGGPWADLAAEARLLADCRSSQIARLNGHVGYYASLRRKYEAAAARPWLPLLPDPPPPE